MLAAESEQHTEPGRDARDERNGSAVISMIDADPKPQTGPSGHESPRLGLDARDERCKGFRRGPHFARHGAISLTLKLIRSLSQRR